MSAFIRRLIAAAGYSPRSCAALLLTLVRRALTARDTDAGKGSLIPRLLPGVRYAQTFDSSARIGSRELCGLREHPKLREVRWCVAAAPIVYVEKAANRHTSERYGIAPESVACSVHRGDRGELPDGARARNHSLLGKRCATLTAARLQRGWGVSLCIQTPHGSTTSCAPDGRAHGIEAAAQRQRAPPTSRKAKHRLTSREGAKRTLCRVVGVTGFEPATSTSQT